MFWFACVLAFVCLLDCLLACFQVVATATANVATAKEVVKAFVARVAKHDGEAPMSTAMTGACMTAPDRIPPTRRTQLQELVGVFFVRLLVCLCVCPLCMCAFVLPFVRLRVDGCNFLLTAASRTDMRCVGVVCIGA